MELNSSQFSDTLSPARLLLMIAYISFVRSDVR